MARRDRAPYVVDTAATRSLHFGPARVQSRMLRRDPALLVFDYTRLMMAFLLFVPAPRRIAQIGLGGGSLAKFCHAWLRRARIDVVELDARVIALREAFALPRDDRRLRVRLGDGAAFVAAQTDVYDVLLLDGYDEAGMPARLRSAAFCQACRRALRPQGLLVVNLDRSDRGFSTFLRRLHSVFDGQVRTVDDEDSGNCVVFAGARALRRVGVLRRPAGLDPSGWAQLVTVFARLREV